MHKKRPRDPISTVATPLSMTAGSAKIRDGRSVFTPGLSSVATNWIDRDLANRQFSFSLSDKSLIWSDRVHPCESVGLVFVVAVAFAVSRGQGKQQSKHV